MKKITILTIILFTSLVAFAQFEKGRALIGGSLAFSTETQKSKGNGSTVTLGKETSFSFDPQAGYFIIDNLAVGAGLGITMTKWKDEFDNDEDESYTSFEFQPVVRYYLPVGVFFQGQVGVGTAKWKYEDGSPDEKYGTSSFSLAVGYAHFLNEHVAVEPVVAYRSRGQKDKDTDYKYVYGGFFFGLGIQVYINPLNDLLK